MLVVPRQPPWICVYGSGSLSSTVNQAAKTDGTLKELGLLPCVSLFCFSSINMMKGSSGSAGEWWHNSTAFHLQTGMRFVT